ncbi:hypothetical protein KIW84_021525 [Lathyrus oleraceus]|uniref:Uncharacterized protein n=1 Tax=Pisum sativum TaxID=3888 RepID=A0A9D5B9G7_PEA|nr:hypothetical protein KIW84_021525 [Pisum sativum]
MVRSMMSHADLPNSFWGHALLTAAYTRNRVPSKKETQVVVEEQPAQVEQDQRRSSRIRHIPERYGYLITDQGDVLLMDQDESVTYQEAITGPVS